MMSDDLTDFRLKITDFPTILYPTTLLRDLVAFLVSHFSWGTHLNGIDDLDPSILSAYIRKLDVFIGVGDNVFDIVS